MRRANQARTAVAAAACGVLLASLVSCVGADDGEAGKGADRSREPSGTDRAATHPDRIPDLGDRVRARIPADSRQVVVVYGEDKDSADAELVLFTKHGGGWDKARAWDAHNGKKGWTTDHHEGDNRSPVGVFTLTDAGGVLADPGTDLPYTMSSAFQAPHYWAKSHWHDFDYVIAIDYNRVKGVPPTDPARPQGQSKGGGIWLHMDHGSGTSACVSVSKPGMKYLLRTLEPQRHPVIVMGDKAHLAA